MIYDNIEFHNVEELVPTQNGCLLQRLPQAVRESLSPMGQGMAALASGCELRFKLCGESATVTLSAANSEEANVAFIYFGSIQGGWMLSSKILYSHETKLVIKKPDNMPKLKEISLKSGLGFSPEVVRIVLPYGRVMYHGVEGDVVPPEKEDKPKKTYLAYGSSITHGSLALGAPYTYPFRVSQRLKCDYINLGLAGSARMEKEMAEYIVSRKDWDFASVEMGINMLGSPVDEFERAVCEFVNIISQDPRPIYATSLYGFNGGGQEKGNEFREIVKKHAKGKLIYIDGLEFLNNEAFIAHDMVHPSLEGMESIANKWCEVLRNEVK